MAVTKPGLPSTLTASPLSKAKAGTSTTPTSDEMHNASEVQDLFTRARTQLRRRHELWKKSYRLVHNRVWSSVRDPGMPSPSASEVFPILAALVGWMSDQRTQFECVPSVDPHSQYANFMQGLAKDLEVVLQSIFVTQQLDGEIEKVLWDSMIYGTGFWKVMWDPAEADGAGNATMTRVDPFCIYPDPNATTLEDANYVIEARRMTLAEIERRWPDKVALLTEDMGSGFQDLEQRDDPMTDGNGSGKPMANLGPISPAVGRGYGLPGQGRITLTDETALTVLECWIKENCAYPDLNDPEAEPTIVPEWRVIVTCGNHVLMNEKAKDLWRHGRHPYVRYVMSDLGDFWGISLVDHLAPAQLAVNRLLAALQQHAELCGNPVLMEDVRSGISRTKLVNKPGQRITKNTGSEVAWLTPPDMPSGVSNLVQFWINEMERISGLSAIVRGATPTGRNAQGVLDSVQESAFVRVRLAIRNLERSLAQTGRLLAHLVVENYTLPRTVAIAGETGEKSMLALRGRHFYSPNSMGADPMDFSLYVLAGSSMPISRTARAQEADTLFAMGAIDHQAVLEAHDYPNRNDILQRVMALQNLGVEVGAQGRNRQR